MTYKVIVTIDPDLRGDTEDDLIIKYDKDLNALIVCNESHPEFIRIVGLNEVDDSDKVKHMFFASSAKLQIELNIAP